jgi:hypothetical protein
MHRSVSAATADGDRNGRRSCVSMAPWYASRAPKSRFNGVHPGDVDLQRVEHLDPVRDEVGDELTEGPVGVQQEGSLRCHLVEQPPRGLPTPRQHRAQNVSPGGRREQGSILHAQVLTTDPEDGQIAACGPDPCGVEPDHDVRDPVEKRNGEFRFGYQVLHPLLVAANVEGGLQNRATETASDRKVRLRVDAPRLLLQPGRASRVVRVRPRVCVKVDVVGLQPRYGRPDDFGQMAAAGELQDPVLGAPLVNVVSLDVRLHKMSRRNAPQANICQVDA